METYIKKKQIYFYGSMMLGLFVLLYCFQSYHYLLAHTVVELFNVIIACGIFVFAVNGRRFFSDSFFPVLGIAYLSVSVLDITHGLAYKGMTVFVGIDDSNVATQLWIASRALEALTLCCVTTLLGKKVRLSYVAAGYAALVVAILFIIFRTSAFPACFIPGVGLTSAKKIGEYCIAGLFCIAILRLSLKRREMDTQVFVLLVLSMSMSVVTELIFTLYESVYGMVNLAGHYCRVLSVAIMYLAIIKVGFVQPLALMFRDIKENEQKIKEKEKQFRLFYENSPIGYQSLNDAGMIVDVNPAWCHLLGYAQQDVVGKWFGDFLVEKSRKMFWDECFPAFKKSGEAKTVVFDMICNKGHIITVEIHGRAVYENGVFLQSHCVLYDITAQEKSLQLLYESETQFREMFDNMSNGVAVYEALNNGEDFVFVDFNKAAQTIEGFNKKEVVGKRVLDVFPGIKDFGLFDVLQAVWRTGQPQRFPLALYKDNRMTGWRENYVYKLPSGGVVAIYADVTKRKQAEDALKKSEEKYKFLLDNLPQRIFYKDYQSVYVSCNQNYANDLGLSPDQIVGKTDYDFYSKERANQYCCDDQRIMASGELTEIEELITKDGKDMVVHTVKTPITDDAGQVVGVLGIFWDITEKRKIEEQLRQAQKMDAIGQLAGGVAHDFNNMLTGILGSAELLSAQCSGDSCMLSNINRIIESGSRAAELTQKLLSFSRKGSLVSVGLDLHDAVREAVSILERSIDRRIKIVVHLDAAVSTMVGDKAQLQSAILNLGINARDAMPEGGLLTVTTQNVFFNEVDCAHASFDIKPGMYIELSVRDSGIGIARELQSRIFEPFFTTKERGKGTGLGLAAVYGTVVEHHGQINVYSEEGSGSLFKLYLLTDEHAAVAVPADDHTLVSGEGIILVVDDEEIMQGMVKHTLVKLGYTVLVAQDGNEAIAVYTKRHADIALVLLDLIMPNKSGRDTFFELRRIDPHVPIVISSGFSDARIDDLLAAGAHSFLSKPYHITALSRAVADAMQERP